MHLNLFVPFMGYLNFESCKWMHLNLYTILVAEGDDGDGSSGISMRSGFKKEGASLCLNEGVNCAS